MSDLNFSVLIQYVHLLPSALLTTIKIGILGFLLALLIAIIVGTLRSIKLPGIISVILTFYVEAFRGTPLLVQLFLVYYGLPAFGI